MPLRKAKLLEEWGRTALRPAREGMHLTREMLARLSGVAASTIRNLESGAHQPNPATIARLCEALDLPSPLCGSELRLCLDEVDYPMAVKTLRGALDEYRTVRADPAAFVEARRVSPHDRMEVMHDAIDAHDAALKLIDALPDDNDRGPPLLNPQSCRPRDWTNRRQRAGLTQAEVAIRAGLSVARLRAIELERENPTEAEARAVDAVLRDGPAKRRRR
ncbi:helix-turn-helix transcriptional regulator [Haliangium sp. UPWRP_2]|uniref:helix-turn-helix transcriptional regulator n=1 Tax=Haliangium sp. UPWRP_2 TaxID=1931276 RepID=UPI000B53C129|nr:helix-turn-helix transcriptional regulator [Haliangium sp. UPWRP_2]PSM31812.1 transcriptional regulator [Haliangium sp. UPWRP_2]